MNRTTHIRRSFFWKFTLVLGAYRLLVHPGPNASPSYLALNMAGVILLSWIISYVYATWIRQKIARYDRIRPDMEPERSCWPVARPRTVCTEAGWY
ncbi:MAG: hypothetical protein V8Q44_07795 [Alistipes ihumii]